MRLLILAIFCLPVSAAMVTPGVGDPGSTPGDAFQFQYTNIAINSNSSMLAGPSVSSDIRDMFGGSFTTLPGEAGRTLFADNSGKVVDDSVTFTTNSPITLTGYSLYLAEDPATPGFRSVTRFRLTMGTLTVSDFTLLNPGQTFAAQYGSFELKLSDSFAPVSGSTFTAIFTTNNFSANGPRIFELDAVTVPEPATLWLMLATLGALAWKLRGRILSVST